MQRVFRNLIYTYRRFKAATILNFIGLVVALSAFFLFSTKINSEWNYNSCCADWEKIYRLELEGPFFGHDTMRLANLCAPLYYMADEMEGVEEAAILPLKIPSVIFAKGEKKLQIGYVDGYGKSLSFWNKNIKPTFRPKSKGADYVYIPRSFAINYFGTTDVIGKELSWQMSGTNLVANIACVYDDFPSACCVSNSIYKYEGNVDSTQLQNFNYHTYVKVADPKDVPGVCSQIRSNLVSSDFRHFVRNPKEIKAHLAWATKAYFSGVDASDKGNETVLYILAISALLVLTLTSTNFVNFSLAAAPMRLKGVNARRVLGASRNRLRFELIMENVVVCIGAFIVTMICMEVLNLFLQGNVSPLSHLFYAMLTFLAAVGIGLASGVYPAFFITNVPPTLALKGTYALPRKVRNRRLIRIGFQLVSSFVIVGFVSTMAMQEVHIFNAEYGYLKHLVYYGDMNSQEALERRDTIRTEIEKIPGVMSVSYSLFELGMDDLYMMWINNSNDSTRTIMNTVMPVDWKYMHTLGIDIIEGRDFRRNDKGVYICNLATKKSFSWVSLGKPLMSDAEARVSEYNVVGFCPNIRFNSFRGRADTPLSFVIVDDDESEYNDMMSVINIRVADDVDKEKILQQIEDVYHNLVPESDPLYLVDLYDGLGKLYHDELIFMIQIGLLALLYVMITLIGVFCQTMFDGEYRRKEIGVRKVFGATTGEILIMFNAHYLRLLGICFFIAVPFIYYLSSLAMESFTDTSRYIYMAYPLSFFIVSMLTIGTVTIQSYRAASAKPVDTVKSNS